MLSSLFSWERSKTLGAERLHPIGMFLGDQIYLRVGESQEWEGEEDWVQTACDSCDLDLSLCLDSIGKHM